MTFREDFIFFDMFSYHQPRQIINEKTIPSHGCAFKPRPLNVFGFCYAKLALVYILFVRTQRGHFVSILPKITGKREKGILTSLGDLSTEDSPR